MKLVKADHFVSPKHRDLVENTLKPSLKVGLVGATVGLFFGGFHGIRMGRRPVIDAIAWSIQGFATATPYWAFRKSLLDKRDQATSRDLVSANALAMFTGGGFGAAIAGSRGILFFGLVCGLLGAGGQKAYNSWQESRTLEKVSKDQKSKWLNSKWSPVTVLTDEEYKGKLQAQIDQLDDEIGFIDEQVKALKSSKDRASDASQREEDKGSQA